MGSNRVAAVLCSDETRDFIAADWVLLALAALDQAGVSPERLARAYRFGKGRDAAILDELDLATEEA